MITSSEIYMLIMLILNSAVKVEDLYVYYNCIISTLKGSNKNKQENRNHSVFVIELQCVKLDVILFTCNIYFWFTVDHHCPWGIDFHGFRGLRLLPMNLRVLEMFFKTKLSYLTFSDTESLIQEITSPRTSKILITHEHVIGSHELEWFHSTCIKYFCLL